MTSVAVRVTTAMVDRAVYRSRGLSATAELLVYSNYKLTAEQTFGNPHTSAVDIVFRRRSTGRRIIQSFHAPADRADVPPVTPQAPAVPRGSATCSGLVDTLDSTHVSVLSQIKQYQSR